MNTPNPDDIQPKLPERPPEEIQIGRSSPTREDVLPPLPDYDFIRKLSFSEKLGAWVQTSWQEHGSWNLILVPVAVCVVLVAVSFFGQVTNKTFSHVTSCGFGSSGLPRR
jgi:hypothetical protein